MALTDNDNNVKAIFAVSPALNTNSDTPIVSQIIEVNDCHGVTFVGVLGALTDSNATYSVTVQDGDTSGDVTNECTVVGSDITRSLPAGDFSDDNSTFQIGYIGKRRYVKLTFTPSGNNSGDIPYALAVIKSGLKKV